MRVHVVLLVLLCSLQGLFFQRSTADEEVSGKIYNGEAEWLPQPKPWEDTYWSGTAPLCLGGCRGRHQELKSDRCGDSSCCWVGSKSLCRVNCGRPDVDYNGVVTGDDWWVGSLVRYECRAGFLLLGDPTRVCQSDGRWTPKPFCLRMCQRGRVEVNERELSGNCSTTCANKSYFGNPKLGCSHLDNCQNKDTGWKRFFSQCVPCVCDCSISCTNTVKLERKRN
ncbi:sushi, von Willebrand factor type A, EGF and pentraxin domain-containing protein 1 isoform X1 [Gadus chalcogrammus]|uniref:sushi, von Willebrand factor type A, EGF and pentraxin domain-containing protein 1 isoform X1 n=1 Tax=Gadus chalcogrammus TaxID=1042646 RepID=UPI0024C34ABC|nr:sushi, von Willebrand factor type A, EGF and pentraxin domain-containing protein 1 isoform X1 [Gadus chalcogrammus]